MGLRVLGIGVGLCVVLVLWTLTLLAYIVLWKSKGLACYIKFICLVVATLVTIILTSIPKVKEPTVNEDQLKVTDGYFIGRIALVVIMGVFAVLSCVIMTLTHWNQPVYASTLK